MSLSVSVKIKNINQVRAAFLIAPVEMKKNLGKAIAIATQKVARDSKILTPVDTGRLRASTTTHLTLTQGEVSTHTNYDIFVHEGTRYMKGRPFLRNALEQNDTIIQGLFVKAVNDTLGSIGKRT